MKQIRAFLFILILIILSGNAESSLRTATAIPVHPPSTGVSYLPIVRSRPCPAESPKAAVALAYNQRGTPHGLLCVPKTNYYHTWGWTMDSDWRGTRLPMVWTAEKNGLDYVLGWSKYLDQWEVINDQEYSGFLLFANEPDRPDQADLTPEEVALMYLRMTEICPNCQFVGPMYSAADAGQMVREVWDICAELGCDMSKLYAHSLHIYPRPDLNYGPAGRVRDFCLIVEGQEDCSRPIWVTEFGYRSCFAGVYKVFKNWTIEALNHPGIEQVFIYTTFQEPKAECHFYGMLDWDKWELFGINELSPFGRAWRDGIVEAGLQSD